MVQLVSEYVALERRGADDLWGRCPFHEEKSASFHVRPERGYYKCFGCGKGGDLFSFVMELEGLSFGEALRTLAQRAGIEVESASPAEQAREARRAELLRASELVAAFYERVLWSDTTAGRRGREYLAGREIEEETIRAFRLGVAPDEWDALPRLARERRIELEVLEELGLVRRGRGGGRPYDFFRDRLMFPIATEQGKVVGFGGRTLGDDERKYMNSPEVAGLYEKRRLLYGLDRAKQGRPKRLVVVEGYVDVVVPHQAGRTEFVAALGTAFTPEQAKLARRYVDEVVLLFDGDEAGAAATQRALANLVGQEGLTLRVARLPAGLDPDDAVRQDPGLLDRALGEADDVIGFLITETLRGWDAASAAGHERAIRAAIRLLARIPDPIRLATELRQVAERFGLPEDVLRAELTSARKDDGRRRARAGRDRPQATGGEDRKPLPGNGLEAELLEALLAVPHGAVKVEGEGFGPDLFTAGPLRVAAAAIFDEARERGAVDPSGVLARLEDARARELVGRLIGLGEEYERRFGLKKDYEGVLQGLDQLVRRDLRQRSQEIKRQLRLAPDPDTKKRLLEEWSRLEAELRPGDAPDGDEGCRVA